MAADTLSSASQFLKEYQANFANSDAQKASELNGEFMLRTKKIPVGGKSLNVTWETEYSDGVGESVLTEGGNFASPQASAAKNPTLGIVHRSFAVEVTGHLLKAGKADAMAFENAKNWIKKKNKELVERAKKRRARDIMWNGTAEYGTVAVADNTADKAYFTVTAGGVPLNFFEAGDVVGFYDAASGGNLTGSGRVVGVDPAAGRVYMSTMAGVSAGNFISLVAYYNATMPNGIRNLVSNTGTLQGLDRTHGANTWLRCVLKDNAAAAMGASFVDEVRDAAFVQNYARDGGPKVWVSNSKTRRWATLSTRDQVRFLSPEKTSLGATQVGINTDSGETRLIVDELCMDGELFAIDPSSFVEAAPEGGSGLEYVEVGGSHILQKVGSGGYADAQQIIGVMRWNNGLETARSNVKGYNFASP